MASLGGLFGGGLVALKFMIPGICTEVGKSLKNKDDNDTGFDDAGGNVVIALGPVIPAFLDGDQKKIRKVLIAVRDTINGYLAQNPNA